MRIRLIAISVAFAIGLAALPSSNANAQDNPACSSPSPLAWPLCAAGVVLGTAVNIASAPIWLAAGEPPPYQYGNNRPPPPPGYYPPPNYYYGPH
jgi:hypothetical protein